MSSKFSALLDWVAAKCAAAIAVVPTPEVVHAPSSIMSSVQSATTLPNTHACHLSCLGIRRSVRHPNRHRRDVTAAVPGTGGGSGGCDGTFRRIFPQPAVAWRDMQLAARHGNCLLSQPEDAASKTSRHSMKITIIRPHTVHFFLTSQVHSVFLVPDPSPLLRHHGRIAADVVDRRRHAAAMCCCR